MVLVHLGEYLTNESQLQLALNLIRLEISESNAGTIVVRRRLTMFGDFWMSFSNLTEKHLVRQRQTEIYGGGHLKTENLSATVQKSLLLLFVFFSLLLIPIYLSWIGMCPLISRSVVNEISNSHLNRSQYTPNFASRSGINKTVAKVIFSLNFCCFWLWLPSIFSLSFSTLKDSPKILKRYFYLWFFWLFRDCSLPAPPWDW